METKKTMFQAHRKANNYIHMAKIYLNLFLKYILFQLVYELHYQVITISF